MNLWYSTPCFQRYDLSRICFAQRKWAIEKLASRGIEANCVVVADDENLDIAREFGFATVERDNEWLGRRFNDGYQYAIEHGATHVAPIGSDSWSDPQFIIDAINNDEAGVLEEPDSPFVVSSRHYTRINALGTCRRQLWVPVLQGVTYLIPATALKAVGNRPCQEEIRRGCDGSTWQRISTVFQAKVIWAENNLFETVGFESWPQITLFEKLGGRWGRGDSHTEVISKLADVYPQHLVDSMEEFYEKRRLEKGDSVLTSGEIDERVRMIVAQVLSGPKTPTAVRQKARPYIEQAVRLALESQ